MKRKKAGQLNAELRKETCPYEAGEVVQEMTKDIPEQLYQCARNHREVIDEPEYCVIMLLRKEPHLENIIRHLYFAWPYMPKPRPDQSVFIYNKAKDSLDLLWTLPPAHALAMLSEMQVVDQGYFNMKKWCDLYWDELKGKRVWAEEIRKWTGCKLETEDEFLKAHSEELAKLSLNFPDSGGSDSLNFTVVDGQKVSDGAEPTVYKCYMDTPT